MCKNIVSFVVILGYVTALTILSWFSVSVVVANEKDVPGETSKRGGELVIGMESPPPHLNPAIHSGIYVALPGTQIFASPLRFDEHWNPQPYLAEQWEVAEDGLSVTLHLVKGATFHDGVSITSKDVAFSVMIVKKYHPFSSMFAKVERVDTPDAQTAIIHLKEPHPAILLAMSPALLPILPEHIYGDGQDIRTHPANIVPIGSGPFRVIEHVPNQHIILERYDGFFIKGRPYLDRIYMTYFLHPQEVLLAVEQNEVQLCSFILDLDELDRLSGKSHLKITSKGYQGIGAMLWLAFNLQKKPFDDLRVRQAFAYAIDREFIANTLFHGKAKVATGPISPDSPFYSQNVELYDVDVNKANELLDMAGYQRGPDGKRFTVTMDTLSGAYTLSTAKFLRYELGRKIGVDVRVRAPSNFLEWTERVSNSDFQCTLDVVFNWGDPVIGVHRIYDSRNIRKGVMWTNTQHYKNSEVDALLDAAGSETDIGKRKELYATFQNIVSKELPVYWLMMIPYHTVYHKDLRGIDDNIWGVLSPLDRLYWQKE